MKITRLMLAVCALAGCGVVGTVGGGGGGGGTGIDRVLSLDPQKDFNALSAQERETMCEDAIKARKSLISQAEMCTAMGVALAALDANSSETCQAAFSACMNAPGNDLCYVNKSASCSARVSEIDKCLVDLFNQAAEVMGGIDCSDVAGSIVVLSQLETKPASYTALASKCPDLIQ